MAFSKIRSSGFAVSSELFSSEMTALDADHANALDKSIAGDTLVGAVGMASTAAINVNTSGAAITSSVAGGIVGSALGSIKSTTVGAFQLGGGATDWPQFTAAARSRIIVTPIHPNEYSGGPLATGTPPSTWLTTLANALLPGGSLGGGGTTQVVNSGNANVYAYYVPITALHNGAVLSLASLNLIGAAAHSSLPQTMPAFQLYRASVTTAGAAVVTLASGGFAVDPTATVGAYKAAHSWSLTCNQNNTIDTTQYMYFAIVWDEGGTNSVIGNLYSGIAVTYSQIANMAFP